MTNEKGYNKRKKEQRKQKRLSLLIGVDLCSCGGGNQLRCDGICRKKHTNPTTNQVECGEIYRVDESLMKNKNRRPKRTWKYGQQNDAYRNQEEKQSRREKWERNRS